MSKNIALIILPPINSDFLPNAKEPLTFNGFCKRAKKIISSYQKVGIKNIYLLAPKNKELAKELEQPDCKVVYDADYKSNSFSSLVKGVLALNKKIEATFFMPLDMDCIRTNGLLQILNRRKTNRLSKQKSIIIPSFLNQLGHLALVEKKHFEIIINFNTDNSLKLNTYFSNLLPQEAQEDFLIGNCHSSLSQQDTIDFFPLPDSGIISNFNNNTDENLIFLTKTSKGEQADLSECFHLLLTADLPERTKKHCLKIALGSLRIGIALKEKLPHDFSLLNCVCGGLLHDICRTQKKHGIAGAEYLRSFGFEVLANIVGSHTNLPKPVLKKINIFLNEEKLYTIKADDLVEDIDYLYPSVCVFLADKFYASDQHISLIERHRLIEERFVDNDKALNALASREKVAKAVEQFFNELTKKKAEECVEIPSKNPYEQALLYLIEKYPFIVFLV